jgi:hypothetical protein
MPHFKINTIRHVKRITSDFQLTVYDVACCTAVYKCTANFTHKSLFLNDNFGWLYERVFTISVRCSNVFYTEETKTTPQKLCVLDVFISCAAGFKVFCNFIGCSKLENLAYIHSWCLSKSAQWEPQLPAKLGRLLWPPKSGPWTSMLN